ncbi:hypothetical protein B0J14DRAFT_488300 [Halenospora varia]|nr:hypothetical protein B0J14DRAFT_488300 [Halenospora varia]
MGIEMVDLFVGPEIFRVHKALFCQRVPYFSTMFQGGFKEASDSQATFPEDSSESFSLLIE